MISGLRFFRLHILVGLALFVVTSFARADKPHMYALLIGLGKYNVEKQGYPELDGANDVDRMKDFLLNRVDALEPKNIWTLTSSTETSKAAIESAVKKDL